MVKFLEVRGVAFIRDLSGMVRFVPLNTAKMMEHASTCNILQTGKSTNEILEMPGFEKEKARWKSLRP